MKVMKSKSDWMQSKPLLYFLFFLYLITVGTFFYREDTPSLIVFYLLFLLFFLISKNMIVVLGSTLSLMLVLILLRQSVKEGLTQPEETIKPGDPMPGSKKIPEDKEVDDFEMTFQNLEKNLNDINRIEEATRLKLNSLREMHVKSANKEKEKDATINAPTKPVPPL